MGPKKGRRVPLKKLPLTVFLNLSWGHRGRYSAEGGEGDKGKGERGTETEGGGQEGGGEKGGSYKLVIGGSGRKACKDRQK